MIRLLLLFTISWLVPINAKAQIACSDDNILGLWKECGKVMSMTYNQPPAVINTDSLKKKFHEYNNSTGDTWRFNTDGTYVYEMMAANIKHKGRHYQVVENKCALKLSSRQRNLIRIVYIDDSCMILWHNNPKTAYLTVYRK